MTQTTPTTDHYLSLFDQRADRFTQVVDAVRDRDGGWDAPAPCAGWSARDVVGHVVDSQRDFLERQGLDAGPAPDLADPAAAWRRQRDHVTSVLRSGDVASTEYDGYFGPTTIAATVADFYGWDLVVHGSDVARATGQDWSVTEEEADALHATADEWGDALHSEGVCAAPVEVGPDASATDRLLARLGRDPRWEPSVSRPARA
jgi:uncharacterized protein (TIGR03086 family)